MSFPGNHILTNVVQGDNYYDIETLKEYTVHAFANHFVFKDDSYVVLVPAGIPVGQPLGNTKICPLQTFKQKFAPMNNRYTYKVDTTG
jgi:hypothetical protein